MDAYSSPGRGSREAYSPPLRLRASTGESEVAVRLISFTEPASAARRCPASVSFDMLENKPGCEWRSKESVASSSWRVGPDGTLEVVAHADATRGRAAAM